MKILCLNVRGVGRKEKCRALKKLINKQKPACVFLQETKTDKVNDRLVDSLWKNNGLKYCFSESDGSAGGLLVIWDESVLHLSLALKQKRFIWLKGSMKGVKDCMNLINIYAPNEESERKSFFDELSRIKSNDQELWLIAGHFNVVLKESERIGSSDANSSMVTFNSFVQKTVLIDLPLKGRSFTRYGGGQHISMSRLDRFLINSTWFSTFSSIVQSALPESLSDHSPICLEIDEMNWGPKPFRFFNFWLEEKDFNLLVKDKWTSYKSKEGHGASLFSKLKQLKTDIKAWKGYLKEGVSTDLQFLEEEINTLEVKLENDTTNEGLVQEIVGKKKELWRLRKIDDRIWRQKSRMKWTKEGDRNSKFFHCVANSKWNKNLLTHIAIGDRILKTPKELKNAVEHHFKKQFQNVDSLSFSAASLLFNKLSQEQMVALEKPFTEQEIWVAIRDCDGNKAPGPDGFNFNFFKAHWDTLKPDILTLMKEFHQTSKLPKGVNTSFITLIVKKQCTETLNDYRPISLVSSVYKILAKTLANRLKTVMNCIIEGSQSAYIKGRQILDSILIANEVVDHLKRSNCGGLALKLDFEKAFDSINWSFVALASLYVLMMTNPSKL